MLRPITVIAAAWAIYSLFHRAWFSASIFLAAWFFISVIGYDVAKPSAIDRQKSGNDEIYLVAKGVGKTALVFFVLIVIVMITRGFRWYFAIPAAWLLGICAAAVPMVVVAFVVGHFWRRNAF